MESTAECINNLRQLLSQAVSTKRMVNAHAKRLGSVSDTQMLRNQLNTLLSRLKQQLEQGAEAASKASRSSTEEFNGPEAVRLRHITNVQQMEKQLMAIANEYPGLVRSIAAKQEQAPARPRREAAKPDEIPLLGMEDEAGSSQPRPPDQQQAQLQQAHPEVNQLEVQQLSQDIQERDRDIHALVGSAIEIQQVAADIATLINHQATAVDQVAVNIDNVSHNVDRGAEQIARAHARQRKVRIDCVGWVLIVIGAVCGAYVGIELL
jgi:t-SNARE complex subunit (syntaxin)